MAHWRTGNAAQDPPSLPYRPDVDGLRALAVSLVVCFHAFPTLVPGGFVGVDVFFVISGYLISAIVAKQVKSGNFSLFHFYARRILRIFPALLLVLVFCLVASWALLVSHEFRRLGSQVAAGAGFVSNFQFWLEAGYFDSSAHAKPLLHLWSLAVEEQFYIVWPCMLAVTLRRRWPKVSVLLVLSLASLAYAQYAVLVDPVAAFYSPLSRMWEFLLGAMLAVQLPAARDRPPLLDRALSGLLAWLGLVLIVGAGLLIHQHQPFPGLLAVLPALGAALLIAAGPAAKLNAALLSSPIMVLLGRISYPLYLWHWPLLVFVRIALGHEPGRIARMMIVLTSLVLAWLSWRWLERGLQRQPAAVAVPGLAAACVVAGALGLGVWAGMLAPRNADPSLDAALAAAADWTFPKGLTPVTVAGITVCQVGAGGPPKVMWLGDSHVQQYAPRLVALAAAGRLAAASSQIATSAGCPPIPGVFEDGPSHRDCARYRDAALRHLFSGPAEHVVIGACWTCYFLDEARPRKAGERNDYYVLENGRREGFRDGAGVALAMPRLEQLLKQLVGSKRRVYLLLDNPRGPDFDPTHLLSGSRLGRLELPPQAMTAPLSVDEQRLNQALLAMASRTGARPIVPVDHLCRQLDCLRMLPDGQPIFMDAGHLRASFVRDHAGFVDAPLATGP